MGKSGCSEEHSPSHEDSTAEDDALEITAIFIDEGASDWSAA